jgi:pimeloyl-ACP methyl ester carboxylesterase
MEAEPTMTNEPAGRIAMLSGDSDEPSLLVRRLEGPGSPVLYVHGATFPSSLSVAYRFGGRSWMDELGAAGFDIWAFDFAGFGGSERPRGMKDDANGPPIGCTPDAARQIERVVDHIVATTHHKRVSLIAHSWGSIPACLYATRFRQRIDKICLFAPVVPRDTPNRPSANVVARWRLVTIAQQLARFTEDLPAGHAPVLIDPTLGAWGPAYLASDPDAEMRVPPAVKIPAGPASDIALTRSGALQYRPENIVPPTLVVRGEWDSVSTEADAQWLVSRVSAPRKLAITIPKGTHLMHLEYSRERLFAAVRDFLSEDSK